ncbi:MAG: NAD(P)H-dependent oxidoreductase [Magnetospiraceae bacterium]
MSKGAGTDSIRQEDGQPAYPRRILILFAHPAISRSEINRPLFESSRTVPGITTVDLYAEYPDLDIDVEREQARLVNHDVIVFMHPLYWYSTPAILKEWQDLVLEYGFAYGKKGTALRGKILFNAITAGGAKLAYHAEGYNHFTIRELLRPIEQTALLCGMRYLPPFALYDARTAVEEGRVWQHVAQWEAFIVALRDDRINLGKVVRLHNLSGSLDGILKGAEE